MNTNTYANSLMRVTGRNAGTNGVVNALDRSQVQFAGMRLHTLDKQHFQSRVVAIISAYWMSTNIDFKVLKVVVGKNCTEGGYRMEVISLDHRHETVLFLSESKAELLAKINGAFDVICDLGL